MWRRLGKGCRWRDVESNLTSSVQGFRRPISELLTEAHGMFNASNTKEARAWRAGYMSALYALRANALPPAYAATDDVRQIQAGIELAILRLERGPEVAA